MAKNSDQRAGGFETENTGGVLSGLLADEEHLDRRAMFRLGTWGVASVGAVVVAVLANQTAMKSRHDEVAALDLARQSQQIQSVAKESQNETRRLAAAIDTLNGDRDRMYSRLTTLEQGLDSMTGAIAKQNTAATPPAAMLVGPPAPPASTVQPVAQATAPEPAPAVAPVTTSVAPVTASVAPVTTTTATATPATEKPRAEAKNEAKKPAPPATVTAAAATPAPAPSSPPAATSAEPLMTSKSLMAPPDGMVAKLIEPEPLAKIATATPPVTPPAPALMMGPSAPAPSSPAASAAPEAPAPKPAANKLAAAEPAPSTPAPLAVKHTEFGVDVGGANSVSGLRALWRGLLKSRSNAPLAALQPIIVVKERDNGLGMQLRLVAGPLDDAAAAARICAKIAENERPCQTTVFDGQRLAIKAEDAPTTTEAIAAKSAAEKSSSEKPSDQASEKSASDKSSAKPGFARQGSHRRGYSYSRRVPEQAPQPPPQQTSTLSWFRLRSQ